MRPFELQPPDRRHRHDDDDEIADGVEGGVGVPRGTEVEAAARDLPVPDSVYGVAFEDRGDGERE